MITTRTLPSAFLLALLLAGGVFAQDDDTAADATGPEVPTLSEIANLMQEQGTKLRAVQSRLAGVPEVREILENVESAEARRSDLETQVGEALEKRSPSYGLQTLREQAVVLRDRFQGWSDKLDAKFDERSRDLEALRVGRAALKRVTERATEMPGALVDEIDSLRVRGDSIEPELTARLNTLVDAQTRISREKTAVVNLIEQLDAAFERDAQELFRRDTPRLWHAWSPPRGDESGELPIVAALRDLDAYTTERRELLIAHALFVVVLTGLFMVLQRSARRGEEVDAGLSKAAEALGNPFSAALVLGLLPSFWIHSLAPRIVVVVSYVLISVPLLHLLGKHLPSVLRPATRALVAAVVLYFLLALLADQFSLRHRLGLLAVTGVGAVAFARAQRGSVVTEAIRGPRARALFVAATRLASASLVGAVLANVFGHSRLADLLARATINSTYFGLITFVGTILLRAFVDLSIRSRALQSLRIVRNRTILISRRLKNALNVAAALFWVLVVLIITRLLGPLRGLANRILGQDFGIGDIRLSVGDLFVFGLTLWVALLIARFVRFTLEEGVLPAVSLPRGVPATVSKLTGYAIVTLGFMVALGAAGFPLDRLTILAGAFGLGLGFGLQNLIANFVSGLILLIERPIQVGDTIEFGTRTGRVTRIGIRSSVVRTWDGAEVNVPNGELVSREVVNWTMSDALRRLVIPVSVSYGTEPTIIPEILLPAATEHEGIVDDPKPEVLFKGFGESSLDFELRCWTQSPDWIRHKSDITFAVHARLKAAGVEIPFPQRDLHLRSSAIGPVPPSPAEPR